ncbi:MAG: ATP-binding protein [Verrucomicrobiales bacterium]|nr:ATP-binding protein [Verrucomicrobiales bacterium]
MNTGWRTFFVSALFGINISILVGVAIAAWASKAKLSMSRESVQQLNRLDLGMSDLERLIIDTETGQRGFLITGDEDFLEPFMKARGDKKELLQNLEEQVVEFPVLSASLESAVSKVEERDAELLEAVQIRLLEGFEMSQSAIRAEVRKDLTNAVRAEVRGMRSTLSLMIEEAERKFQKTLSRVTLVMNLAAFFALGTGIIGVGLLLGSLREQGRVREMEKEKDAAQRADREKSKFLASMNHEIRTPLNAMLGFTELLEAEVSSTRGKRFLSAISKSGASLAELINDILDLSKIESGILELDEAPVSVSDFARGITLLFESEAAGSGIKFSVEVDEACPEILVLDSMRLRQIMVNLVGNAFKFTEAGRITVRFFSSEVTKGQACTFFVEVSDTGRGIPEDKMATIFKPFEQVDLLDEMQGGTGLGLSISRELVFLMSGTLEVESNVGEGALFRVILPNVEQCDHLSLEHVQDYEGWHLNQLSASKILVVDDNPYNRDLIEGFFEESHHALAFAGNGLEALQKLERQRFDLVLMDIRMPVMDGEVARQRMLENPDWSGIPVIAITASSLLKEERRLRESFEGYIRKPFTGLRLFSALKDVLSSAEGNRLKERNNTETKAVSTPVPEGDHTELVNSLGELYEAEWEELTSAMVFSEVLSVAQVIDDLAKQYDVEALSDYAGELVSMTERFDQSGLERKLAEFSGIITEISGVEREA